MSGSFNQRRVAETIRVSQAEWRNGYEVGKQSRKPLRGIDTRSISFRDGYYRGRNELLGRVKDTPLATAPARMTAAEEAIAQRERARHIARHDPDVPDDVLEKCHPAFRETYYRTLRNLEQEYTGGVDFWYDDRTKAEKREDSIAADRAAENEY